MVRRLANAMDHVRQSKAFASANVKETVCAFHAAHPATVAVSLAVRFVEYRRRLDKKASEKYIDD